MACDGGKVSMQFQLTVSDFALFRFFEVGAFRQCDPLASSDVAVNHESEGVQDVALKRLKAARRAHGCQLNPILQNCYMRQ